MAEQKSVLWPIHDDAATGHGGAPCAWRRPLPSSRIDEPGAGLNEWEASSNDGASGGERSERALGLSRRDAPARGGDRERRGGDDFDGIGAARRPAAAARIDSASA